MLRAVDAQHVGLSRVGIGQPQQNFDGRGFASSVFAEQRTDHAGGHFQRDVIQRRL